MNTQPKPNFKAAIPLPADIIREALELDPTSKTWLRWKRRPLWHFLTRRAWKIWNTKYAGKPAGSEHVNGHGGKYFMSRLNNKHFQSHRIVYFLVFGADPGAMNIDHIDGNGRNNDPANLRLATKSENMRNRSTQKNNTSGCKGVGWDKKNQKWRARIRYNGEHHHLGLFDTPKEAHAAYVRAATELHGEFARAS